MDKSARLGKHARYIITLSIGLKIPTSTISKSIIYLTMFRQPNCYGIVTVCITKNNDRLFYNIRYHKKQNRDHHQKVKEN